MSKSNIFEISNKKYFYHFAFMFQESFYSCAYFVNKHITAHIIFLKVREAIHRGNKLTHTHTE